MLATQHSQQVNLHKEICVAQQTTRDNAQLYTRSYLSTPGSFLPGKIGPVGPFLPVILVPRTKITSGPKLP